MTSLLKNPAFKCITTEQETLHVNKKTPPPLVIRFQIIHTKLNLENEGEMPGFSYSRLEIREPTWRIPSTRISLSLSDLPKEKTLRLAY